MQRETKVPTDIQSATEIRPQPTQEKFLESPADIAIFGGSAGGGKTFSLLLDAMRHRDNPAYGAVLFRRTGVEIRSEGGMWDTSEELYPHTGAWGSSQALTWKWHSGAKVKMSHLEFDKDRFAWAGSQIPFIGFDELVQFSEKQFFFLLGRNRSTAGVRCVVRATTNPDPDSWVRDFIRWWIDEDSGYPIPERDGVLRWFARSGDRILWADEPEELTVRLGKECKPLSVTFIASKVYDNQILLKKDPDYLSKLMALPYVERMQLLEGNWNVRASAGNVFRREWFEIVDALPARMREVRTWDFGASEVTKESKDPDWTAGLRVGRCPDKLFWIVDLAMDRLRAFGVEKLLLDTAKADGHRVEIVLPQDPGAAGKGEADRNVRMLSGYAVRAIPVRKDKIVRAQLASAQAERHNIKVLRAPWNKPFLEQLTNFPQGDHDDAVDVLSDAISVLSVQPGEFRPVASTDRVAQAYRARTVRSTDC